jgi:hypothetical protein
MSNFRVSTIKMDDHELVKSMKFDNKEDAEHYAKNQSATDSKHIYEVQKNNEGEFFTIKSYINGQIV